MKFKGIVTAALAVVMFSIPAIGEEPPGPDQTDPAVLLEELAEADPAEAQRIDRQLRALWSKSGSPAMDLLLKRGRDALEAEDYALAVDHLTALTDHAPDFAEGWHMRASAFFRQERFGLALADLERALALNPDNYYAIHGLGAILETLGEEELAFEAYSRALALHPHHEEVTKAVERLKSGVEGTSL